MVRIKLELEVGDKIKLDIGDYELVRDSPYELFPRIIKIHWRYGQITNIIYGEKPRKDHAIVDFGCAKMKIYLPHLRNLYEHKDLKLLSCA